jgi:hypothetical protein
MMLTTLRRKSVAQIYKSNKLDARWTGPYAIQTVHVNGTLTIRLNTHTFGRFNVRRLKPYPSSRIELNPDDAFLC